MPIPLSLSILSFLSLVATHALGQDSSICGTPPPVADESLKGQIKGKAQLLTKYLGGAELTGQVETSRTEIFSKYPDAEESRWNSFFQYQVCMLIMLDKSTTSAQKLNSLKEIQREFRKPVVKTSTIIIRSSDKFIDNRRFGRVDGSLGSIELRVDEKLVTKAALDKPFGSHKLTLTHGEHSFEFRAKIYGAGSNGAILKDNCQGTFSVGESGTFEPYIVIEAVGLEGGFVSCSLDPA